MRWKSWLTLPNIVIILSALFVCYKLYSLPTRVDSHEVRITTLEHDSIALKTKLDLCLQAIYDIRADVKHIMQEK